MRDDPERSGPGARGATEERYRRLFEHVPALVYALDTEGVILEINPAAEAALGRRAEEVIGRHFTNVIPAADIESVVTLADAVRGGDVRVIEWEARLLRPDGTTRFIHFRSMPLVQDGENAGSYGIGVDVTESRESARYIARSARLATVGSLISGIAHQLNNPLNSIRNFAELLLLEQRSEEDREALEIIRNEADRAARVVTDLRTVNRQTSSEGTREPIDLNQTVAHVLQLRAYALGSKRIEVVEQLEPALPPVLAGTAELEQALLQLLLNAEQAVADAEEGSRRIDIRTARTGDRVTLQIRDSGSGIPRHRPDKLFEPHGGGGADNGGALGISIVEKIVRESGGDLHVTSNESGTLFTLVLESAVHDPRTEPEADARGRPLRILLVEDEDSLRRSIARYLERRGHTVEQAGDGEQALHLLSFGARFDAVITDLRMPTVDGEALLKKLAAEFPALHNRTIAVTADPPLLRDGIAEVRLGVPVLVKPVTLHAIAKAVEHRAELGRLR